MKWSIFSHAYLLSACLLCWVFVHVKHFGLVLFCFVFTDHMENILQGQHGYTRQCSSVSSTGIFKLSWAEQHRSCRPPAVVFLVRWASAAKYCPFSHGLPGMGVFKLGLYVLYKVQNTNWNGDIFIYQYPDSQFPFFLFPKIDLLKNMREYRFSSSSQSLHIKSLPSQFPKERKKKRQTTFTLCIFLGCTVSGCTNHWGSKYKHSSNLSAVNSRKKMTLTVWLTNSLAIEVISNSLLWTKPKKGTI